MAVATINLKGKEYATVASRVREFRKNAPLGCIETHFKVVEGNMVSFSARVKVADGENGNAYATGHSYGNIGDGKRKT